MVLTVEPGLYISRMRMPEQYRGIGIRIEDDIVITETGNEKFHRQRGEKAGRNRSVDGSCEKAMSVIIVGGGMAGATLALAISRLSHGALPVHLIEATAPESHAHPGFDGRAIALAAGTCQQLARIGVWRSLATQPPSLPCMSAIVVTLDLSPSPQKLPTGGAGTGCRIAQCRATAVCIAA